MKIKSFKNALSGNLSRKLLSFLLAFVLSIGLLTGLSDTAMAADTNSKASDFNTTTTNNVLPEDIYVALGDSVPAGYGLSDTKDCFVNQFSDKMKENGFANSMFNYAISGATTDSLLTQLQNMQEANPDALQSIKNASIITINIGGNKVLGPFIKAVNTQLEQQLKTLGITKITEATSQQLLIIAASIYRMNLDATSLANIQQGVQSFKEEFPKVIDWIKTNAPGANIIVSTIYNPIPSYLGFYKTSETLLKDMNTAITGGADQNSYYVADIYSAFTKEQAKGTQITNLNLGQDKTSPISVDIHPNIVGHKLITEVHNELFKTTPILVKTKSNTPVTAIFSITGDTDKNGTLSANISEQCLKTVIEKAKVGAINIGRKNHGIAVILNHSDKSTKALNISFDDTAIALLKSEGVKVITINTSIFTISFDKEAIESLNLNTKGAVTLKSTPITNLSSAAKKLIGSRTVFKLSIIDGNSKKITDLGKGKITLSIPYSIMAKEKASNLFMIYVNSKDQPKLLTGSSYYDGWVSYTTSILSTYGVGYKK